MRIAAVGDVHVGTDSVDRLREEFGPVGDQADVLLLAGDLTRCGTPEEAELLAGVLAGVPVPVVGVLGNHDYHADREDEVIGALQAAGVTMLDGDTVTLSFTTDAGEERLGIAGTAGFGGGFPGGAASEFGEPLMKELVRCTKAHASLLERGLTELAGGGTELAAGDSDGDGHGVDVRIALLHYSPTRDTLRGEHVEVYPFLGSYLLGEAIDRAGADLVLHGHAHRGTERGVTPGGIRVRNVAQPVIRCGYRLFDLAPHRTAEAAEAAESAGEPGATQRVTA